MISEKRSCKIEETEREAPRRTEDRNRQESILQHCNETPETISIQRENVSSVVDRQSWRL